MTITPQPTPFSNEEGPSQESLPIAFPGYTLAGETNRTQDNLTTDEQLRIGCEVDLHDADEVRVRHGLAGVRIAIDERYVHGARGMAGFEFRPRSHVDVRAALLLQCMGFCHGDVLNHSR